MQRQSIGEFKDGLRACLTKLEASKRPEALIRLERLPFRRSASSPGAFAAFPFATTRRLGKRSRRPFHSEKLVSMDSRSSYESQPIVPTFPTSTRPQSAVSLLSSQGQI
jgi:hypothetical protein